MRPALNGKILAFHLLSLVSAPAIEIDGFEYTESQIQEIHKGLSQWDEVGDNAAHLPPEEAIPLLGRGLYKTSLPSIYVIGDRLGVRAKLQKALLEIPGHAEYYGDEIRRLTEEEIVGDEKRQRVWDYQILAELPSEETVKVLGELLFDERDPWKALPPTDGGKPLSNATRAVITLNRLGIKNAPSKKNSFDEADIHTWQLWFQQVKAGTRTFSFEGDDRVYSLADTPPRGRRPASAAANPLSREPASPAGEAAKPGSRWPWLVALTALGSAIVVVLLRKLQKAGLR